MTDIQIQKIMAQAQVFASAWSLVGGVFDNGDALETAEQEKEALRAMLVAPTAEQAPSNETLRTLVLQLMGMKPKYEENIVAGMNLLRNAFLAVAPTAEQDKRDAERLDHGDVFTLIGLAKVLQGIGKDDTSRWCMELAERIALTIGDKELADRTAALAATAQSEGES